MNASAPLPRFTIEELLRSAIDAVEADQQCVFTTRELKDLWGYRSMETARRVSRFLEEERGWKFTATTKEFVNRVGVLTTMRAYIVIPPEGRTEETATGATTINNGLERDTK